MPEWLRCMSSAEQRERPLLKRTTEPLDGPVVLASDEAQLELPHPGLSEAFILFDIIMSFYYISLFD